MVAGDETVICIKTAGGNVARIKANDIEIEYQTTGDRNNPALLLVMGLGAQLTLWPESFCDGLAQRGFYVVRHDNRDCGLSTDFDDWGPADIPAAIAKLMTGRKVDAPYLLQDMAADSLALLEALGIERAHMVGGSMGGMIVQIIAAQHPERTRSMVSIFSTSGRPGLPVGTPAAMAALTSQPPGPAREQLVEHAMKLRTVIGSPGFRPSDAELRTLVERNIDRRYFPAGAARQYLSIIASGDRVEMLKTVRTPTLVLHGEDDPLIPVACGRDVAALVPNAEIETYAGWGHDMPRQLIPTLVDRIATFCKAAG
jgi:pimeloyl-ACP methyl ester carboxylesterase